MGFRLVPKLMTLNDLERRNDRYLAEFRSFTGRLCQSGRRQTYTVCDGNVVQTMQFFAIFAEVTENERIIDRHMRGIDLHPLLDYDATESQSMISI